MLADILTKGIPKEQFMKLRHLIGIQKYIKKPNGTNQPVLEQVISNKNIKSSWSVELNRTNMNNIMKHET